MKYILILFLINFPAYSVSSKCSLQFEDNPKGIPAYLADQLAQLHGTLPSKRLKVHKSYLQAFSKELKLAETNSQKQAYLQALQSQLDPALKKLPEIIRFAKKTPSSQEQGFYNTRVMEAVLATFVKYVPAFLTTSVPNKDWARVSLILQTISKFNPKTGDLSFYQIKKSIEGRYSLKEFLSCK